MNFREEAKYPPNFLKTQFVANVKHGSFTLFKSTGSRKALAVSSMEGLGIDLSLLEASTTFRLLLQSTKIEDYVTLGGEGLNLLSPNNTGSITSFYWITFLEHLLDITIEKNPLVTDIATDLRVQVYPFKMK